MDKEKHRDELAVAINERVTRLQEKIREYGSFNIIANAFVNNLVPPMQMLEGDSKRPSVPEYVALVCLKFPYSPGSGEFTQTRDMAGDLHEIDQLGNEIVRMHSLFHLSEYEIFNEDGSTNETQHMAAMLSAEELLIRNETFEEHHWERLETLYGPYDDYFKKRLGFTAAEAIRICLTIQEFMDESFQEGIAGPRENARAMYDEVIAYKYRNVPPKNFYPPEYLERFKHTPDEQLKMEFMASMATYSMVMMGHTLSFTAGQIAAMEELDVSTVEGFLSNFSIAFQAISVDFSMPEVLHPLKDKPLINHQDNYICPSLFLLDYALDRLFARTLFADNKKIEKYKKQRHDYLLETGMALLTNTLDTTDFHTNLTYEGGELDGLIFCGNNVFFIEAKSHQITDRARKGYIDRLMNHVEDIVADSHYQANRSYRYLKGKKEAAFKKENGSKIFIDGTKFKKAYFISLSLESIKFVSLNLKAGNSLGLFDAETFPWVISLYDLRVICEHMEGPAYLIQYMHRRREFFKLQKFAVDDELDLLAYYLDRNLRFEDILAKAKDAGHIKLPSEAASFNGYYAFESGKLAKRVEKRKHYSSHAVKKLVKALESSGLTNSIDAAVQVLELGTDAKRKLMESIQTVKKRYRKDKNNHDFRIAGERVIDEESWMLSYWVAPEDPALLHYFEETVGGQYQREVTDEFFSIMDNGTTDYKFRKVLYFTTFK